MQYLQLLQFIKDQLKHDPVFKIMQKNGSSIGLLVVYNKVSKTYGWGGEMVLCVRTKCIAFCPSADLGCSSAGL